MLPSLPDDARIWIFTADRSLTSDEQAALREQLGDFIQRWASHGRPVPGGVVLRDDRFVIVAAHLDGGVSGCGIDSLVHAVEEIGENLGVAWVDALHIVYRNAEGDVAVTTRPAFRRLVRAGEVTAATPVFDTTLSSLGDLRAGGFEKPAASSWHGRVFRLMEPA